MKTKIFLFLSFLFGITSMQLSAQKLDQNRKNVVIDSYVVTLRPGVTMDQYVDFLKTKVVSEYDKNFPGSKMTIGCPDSWRRKINIASFIALTQRKNSTNILEMELKCQMNVKQPGRKQDNLLKRKEVNIF